MARDDSAGYAMDSEFALLGALMYDNANTAEIEGLLEGRHFTALLHLEAFNAIMELVAVGQRADPITVGLKLEPFAWFAETGGRRALVDMVDRACASSVVGDFARTIREAWERREMLALGREFVDRLTRRTDQSPALIAEEFEAHMLALQSHNKAIVLVDADEAVDRVFEEYDNPSKAFGIMTGLDPIDDRTGGMRGGELWLMAGRPSMGKSAVASTVARQVATYGVHPNGSRLGVIEINGEMDVEAMTRRHITDLAFDLSTRDAPDYKDIRRRKVRPDSIEVMREAGKQIRQLKHTLKMLKRTGLTLASLRGIVRRQVAKWRRQGIEPGLIIVDHVGLMKAGAEGGNRYQDQTAVAIGIKELAGELGIPILALAQLSREVERRDDKRPILADLRDSGAWEENADGVIGFYRPAYYAEREPEPKRFEDRRLWEANKDSKEIEAIFLKVREGQAGVERLWGDMGRNAIRGSRPDAIYDDAPFSPPPPMSLFSASNEGAKIDMDDGRPEPPLEAYDLDDFT